MKPDVCCFLCKSQYGCMNSKCDHHITARIADDADDNARRLYRNPTQDEALANIDRERRGQTKR